MNRVVVPLDGSELSEAGVRLGDLMARSFGVPIELVHVLSEPSRLALRSTSAPPDREQAADYLAYVARRQLNGSRSTATILVGDPTEQVLNLTENSSGVVLALSTRGRSGFERLAFGSVADKILRSAHVPLAIVRGSDAKVAGSLTTLLVPLDGSPLAEAVLPIVTELASRTGATVTLVRVVEPLWESQPLWHGIEADGAPGNTDGSPELGRILLAEAQRYLEQTSEKLRHAGLRVDWEVRVGSAENEIVRAIETVTPDLVVMATHGRGGLRRWAVGSVTNEVLHRSVVPLLVMPPARQSASGHARD
jgi:nucleotide-binding universal stress UspA family protein